MRLAAALLVLSAGACSHSVVIDTDPTGADVRVNGERLGQAPVTYVETTGWEKLYDVEVSKPGFARARRQVRQSEWNVPLTATAGIGTGIWVIGTAGFGAVLPLPLVCLFWSRQLPDRVVIPLERGPGAAPADAPPAYNY